MRTGCVLHHKYFNGVADAVLAEKYKSLVLEHFQSFAMFGIGNVGLITSVVGDESKYNWNNVDKIVQFANDNNIDISYSSVISGLINGYPDSFKKLSALDRYDALKKHVKIVISRYSGKVSSFKLVNEIIRLEDDNFLGTGRNKSEVVKDIFEWAVGEYSAGRYMLNEHIPFHNVDLFNKFTSFILRLLDKGARLDLIGIEGHFGYHPRSFCIDSHQDVTCQLSKLFEKFSLPICITEFDLSYRNHISEPYPGSEINPEKPFVCDGFKYSCWYEYQSFAYKNFIEVCKKLRLVDSVYFWQIVDDPTITWERPGCGIWDHFLEPKKYMRDVIEMLKKDNASV